MVFTGLGCRKDRDAEHPRRQGDSELDELVGEARADSGRDWLTQESSARIDAGRIVEEERVLQRDGLTFHALHLGHKRDAPGVPV